MAVYDKFARYYDRVFAPLERIGLAEYRRETLALLPENASVLELGSGAGANFEFYPPSRSAISTEISIKMIEVAKTKAADNILINADAQRLPFGENKFDAAFATLVFCSIPKPELAFAELRRVVKPGGKVVLLEHVRPKGVLGYIFDGLNVFTHAVFDDHFNRQTAQIAANSGLNVVEIREKIIGIVNLIVCTV